MAAENWAQVPGVYHRKLGDVLVMGLNDGYVDGAYSSLIGISEAAAKELVTADFRRSPPRQSVNAYALQAGGKTYLIDCGSADAMGPTCGHLPKNLKAAGIDPASVDGILLSHIHPDHSNGLTNLATGVANFPKAEIFVNEVELKHWFNDDLMNKAPPRQRLRWFEWGRAMVAPYIKEGRLKTFKGGDDILPGIATMHSPGHTAGHTCYIIRSAGEAMVVWGDTVHISEVQVPKPDVSVEFDWDPVLAAKSRREVFELAVRDGLLIGGMHMDFPGFHRLKKHGDGYVAIPEQWAFSY